MRRQTSGASKGGVEAISCWLTEEAPGSGRPLAITGQPGARKSSVLARTVHNREPVASFSGVVSTPGRPPPVRGSYAGGRPASSDNACTTDGQRAHRIGDLKDCETTLT